MTAPQATEPSAEAPTVSPLRLGGLSKQERRLTTRFAGGSNGDRMLRVSMLFDHRGYSLPSLAKENIHEVVQCGQPRGDADGGQEAPSSRAPNWRSGVLVKDGSRRPHPKKNNFLLHHVSSYRCSDIYREQQRGSGRWGWGGSREQEQIQAFKNHQQRFVINHKSDLHQGEPGLDRYQSGGGEGGREEGGRRWNGNVWRGKVR